MSKPLNSPLNQGERIHINQNKNDCFFSIGDIVRGKLSNGDEFQGEITAIEIKLQNGKLHSCMDYKYKKGVSLKDMGFDENKIVEQNFEGSVWIENIAEIEILSFKEEKNKKKCQKNITRKGII